MLSFDRSPKELNSPPSSRTKICITLEETEIIKTWLNDYINHYILSIDKTPKTDEKNSVIDSLIYMMDSLYRNGTVHQFFIPANLISLAESVFTSTIARDFVLEGSCRLQYLGLSISSDFLNRLRYTIAESITTSVIYGTDVSKTIMPESIAALFIQDREEIEAVLLNNPWTLFIYVYRLYLSSTDFYRKIVEQN